MCVCVSPIGVGVGGRASLSPRCPPNSNNNHKVDREGKTDAGRRGDNCDWQEKWESAAEKKINLCAQLDVETRD